MTDCGQVNLKEVEQFCEYLGGIEDQVFKNRLEQEAKKRSELEVMRAQQVDTKPNADPGAMMGGDLASTPAAPRRKAAPAVQASDTSSSAAQLLAQSFAMDLDTVDSAATE